MYLYVYYMAKEGMIVGPSIYTPRRTVFTFLGQNCIFVATHTLQLQLVDKMSCKQSRGDLYHILVCIQFAGV